MKLLLTLAAVVFVAAADDKPADPAKADQDKMQGTWTIESSVVNGEPSIPDDEIKSVRLVVKGDKRTILQGDETRAESTYTLDPKAKPKAITVKVGSEGPLKGKDLPGIYELDGDTFKICLNVASAERPKEFKAGEGSGCMLQVCKRAKK